MGGILFNSTWGAPTESYFAPTLSRAQNFVHDFVEFCILEGDSQLFIAENGILLGYSLNINAKKGANTDAGDTFGSALELEGGRLLVSPELLCQDTALFY